MNRTVGYPELRRKLSDIYVLLHRTESPEYRNSFFNVFKHIAVVAEIKSSSGKPQLIVRCRSRIICQFQEDIEKVSQLIYQRTDMKVKSKKDYLTNQKKSGYRSLHLIVWYDIQTISGPKTLQVEIQIRTMAMNFWATTEHSLQYKYKGDIPEHVRDKLTRASDAIEVLDEEMSQVRSEIMDAQIDSQIEINLVKDILRNIENLYRLDNRREVVKIQNEFYRIFSMHNLDELKRFHKQLDIIAEGSRAQSVETRIRN